MAPPQPPATATPAPTRDQLHLFIARLQLLLDRERAAEEEETRLLNSRCSPKLLEQRGLALGGVGVGGVATGLGGKTLVDVVRPAAYHTSTTFPSHTFRNGDPARLEVAGGAGGKGDKSKGGAKGKGKAGDEVGEGVDGIVYRVTPDKIVLAVNGDGEMDLPERLRLVKLANTVTFHRMDKTLARLSKDLLTYAETPLTQALLGLHPPTHTPVPEPTWLTPLNDSQRDAIRFCLSADTFACIHGPPGTGKTHTLVELVYQLLSRPAHAGTSLPPRILICTPSNLALDNILARLYKLSGTAPYSTLLPRSEILRVGHPTRVQRDLVGVSLDYRARASDEGALVRDVSGEIDAGLALLQKKRGERGAVRAKERGAKWDEVRELRKEYRKREGRVVKSVVERARVVLATCHSAGSRQLGETRFDVCLLDEATQAVEPVCWVPVLKSRKLVLAGDPQQLPPTVKGKAGGGKGGKGDGAKSDMKAKEKGKGRDRSEAKRGNGETSRRTGAESSSASPDDSAAEGDVDEGEAAEVAVSSVAPNGGSGAATPEPTGSGGGGIAEPPDGATPEGATAADEQSAPPTAVPATPLAKLSIASAASASAAATPPGLTHPHPHLNPRSLEETLFERLERTYPASTIKRVLKVQYRMHADIATFPSTELYEGELVPDPSVAAHTLADILPAPSTSDANSTLNDGPEVAGADADDEDIPPVVFFDTAGCDFYERAGDGDGHGDAGSKTGADDSRSNANEAAIVETWVRYLVRRGVRPADIGVVTPYQAQVALLSGALSDLVSSGSASASASASGEDGAGGGLTVGSVDGLQGQEREAVVFSLVRSNERGEVGFLGEYRRLNVGMTRAKRHLCVVGDSETVRKGSRYLERWMGWLEERADVRWAGEEGLGLGV